MFSPHVAKIQSKAVARSASRLAPVRTPSGDGHPAREAAQEAEPMRASAGAPALLRNFSKLPVFPPDQTDRLSAFSTAIAWAEPGVIRRSPADRPVTAPPMLHSGLDFRRMRIDADGDAVREVANRGTSGSSAQLPHLAGIQRSFGRHNLSQVLAYQDSRAAVAAHAIGARAYTTGNRVAFAGSPDIYTAAHEAAHIVQQRAGVHLKSGVGEVGDAYERHADAVAARVVLGCSAETLLNRMAPAGSGTSGVQRQVVQRAPISTNYGAFDTTKYDPVGPAGSEYGVDIELTFDPDRTAVDARKIGLTQAVRSQLAGKSVALEPSRKTRVVPSGTGEGSEIDRTTLGAYGNPLYAAAAPGATDKLGDTPTVAGWGQHGWNYTDSTGANQHQIAKLKDQPKLPGHGNDAGQTFETVALAVEGAQSGVYMGSVSWGWSVDGAGKFSKLPLTLKTKGNPSPEFKAAAKQWNKWTTAGTIKTIADSTNVYDASYSVAFTVAKETQVTINNGSFIHDDVPYSPVAIVDGPKAGQTGRIKVTDLKDVGGGRATIPLPIRDQPRAGTEAAEVEGALKKQDYVTAYQILNGQWIRPMLKTLSDLNKKGLLPGLYTHTLDLAEGVDPVRLREAIEAVQFKENKVPLSKEFSEWLDPAKNTSAPADIPEIKAYLGLP